MHNTHALLHTSYRPTLLFRILKQTSADIAGYCDFIASFFCHFVQSLVCLLSVTVQTLDNMRIILLAVLAFSVALPSTVDQNTDFQHQSLVVSAGNSFSLQCLSPTETTFRWAFCPPGSRGSTIIYNGAIINDKVRLAAKASVSNCDGKTCTFDVDNIQLADSGLFTCMRLDVEQYWSVTVLGKCSVLLLLGGKLLADRCRTDDLLPCVSHLLPYSMLYGPQTAEAEHLHQLFSARLYSVHIELLLMCIGLFGNQTNFVSVS